MRVVNYDRKLSDMWKGECLSIAHLSELETWKLKIQKEYVSRWIDSSLDGSEQVQMGG